MPQSFVELLCVSEAQEALTATRLGRRGWPVDSEPAQLRVLPYPFMTYVSISNDCDSGKSTFQEIRGFYGYVRETLNLPLGDSYFPDLLCTGIVPYQPTTKPENVDGILSDPDGPAFRNRIGNYIRYFHLGWFDSIHGFVTSASVKLPYTEEEQKQQPPSDSPDHEPYSPYLRRARLLAVGHPKHKSCARFKFYAPEGWERQVPPRYVVLSYSAPLLGTTVHIRLFEGDQLLSEMIGKTSRSTTPLSSPQAYMIDLFPIAGLARARLHAIEVEVEVTGPPGAFAEVHDIRLVNRLRRDLRRYQRAMESYNLTTPAFTSHGIGLVMSPTYGTEPSSTDRRRLADMPENTHYAVDILWDHGVRFFNTYSNTCTFSAVHIDQLTFLNSLTDGRVVYDFQRYAYAPKGPQGEPDMTFWHRGGKLINMSLIDTLGAGLFGLLAETTGKPGSGGLFYTHAYAANPVDPTQDAEIYSRPMNRQTRDALEALAERYYNLSGATDDARRIYVANLPVMLRYSVVRKQLVDRAYYRPSANAVHIEPWYDPVLDEMIPHTPWARELRGITFHVNDASTARIFIGETEFQELIRNPKGTGERESVTMADVSAPLILAGRIPLPTTRAKVSVVGAEADFGETSQGAPTGQGIQLTLKASSGSLSVKPRSISAANYQALRFVFSKSDSAIRVGLTFEFESGLKITAAESGLKISNRGYQIPVVSESGDRVVIIPFYLMLAGSLRKCPERRTPGLNRITRWTFKLQGAIGSRVRIGAVHLLRDCDQKLSADGFVVAGSVADAQPPIERVRMRWNGVEYESTPTTTGVYFFDRKVPSDSIVEIYGLTKDKVEVEPSNGRFFHIVTNKSDIDFDAAPAPAAP